MQTLKQCNHLRHTQSFLLNHEANSGKIAVVV